MTDEKFSFIDCESCGLHHGSYPIEVGFAHDTLDVESWLIKPHETWSKWNWSFASEKVHGIRRDTLLTDGIDVVESANRLNDSLSGRIVLSDAPSYDENWILTLFAAANVTMKFKIGYFDEFAYRIFFREGDDVEARMTDVLSVINKSFHHTHRAGDDALRLAAIWKGLANPAWLADVAKAPEII